jgi:hypothetical protein
MSPFYVKNVPTGERIVRVIVGLAVAAGAVAALGGWLGWFIAASAAGIVVSGLIGFCPACALFGRKLRQKPAG